MDDVIGYRDETAVGGSTTDFFLELITKWFTAQDPVGYMRLYEIGLHLTEASGNLDGIIELYYDWLTAPTQTASLTGTGAYPSSGGEIDLRIRPTVQKCRAFKMRIKLRGDTITESFLTPKLSHLVFEYGIRGGVGKLKAGQSVGAPI
jgi:hypothetical protein